MDFVHEFMCEKRYRSHDTVTGIVLPLDKLVNTVLAMPAMLMAINPFPSFFSFNPQPYFLPSSQRALRTQRRNPDNAAKGCVNLAPPFRNQGSPSSRWMKS